MKLKIHNLLLALFLTASLFFPANIPIPHLQSENQFASASSAAQNYTITVRNDTDYLLFIRGRDSSGNTYPAVTLMKRDHSTTPTTVHSHDYIFDLSQKKIISGNIYGCWVDPSDLDVNAAYDMQKRCAMAEMTIDEESGHGNADVTFVDTISLPIQIDVQGTGCNPSECSIQTDFEVNEVRNGCPTSKIDYASPFPDVCISADHYCTDSVDGDPTDTAFCTNKLSAEIADCKANYPGCNAGSSTTTNVYGCDGGFFDTEDGKPYCAALNRGVLSSWNNQSDPTVIAQFYQSTAINEYAKWIHNILSTRGYTFPYDDYPSDINQALDLGFNTSTKLTITFFNTQIEVTQQQLHYLPLLFKAY